MIENLRWVVIEHTGGMKSRPVLQVGEDYGPQGIIWETVPTEVIKVDDKGDVIQGEDND